MKRILLYGIALVGLLSSGPTLCQPFPSPQAAIDAINALPNNASQQQLDALWARVKQPHKAKVQAAYNAKKNQLGKAAQPAQPAKQPSGPSQQAIENAKDALQKAADITQLNNLYSGFTEQMKKEPGVKQTYNQKAKDLQKPAAPAPTGPVNIDQVVTAAQQAAQQLQQVNDEIHQAYFKLSSNEDQTKLQNAAQALEKAAYNIAVFLFS